MAAPQEETALLSNKTEEVSQAPKMISKTSPNSVWVQRGLMLTLVTVITLWYFTTPYLVRPHPQFREDMRRLVANLSKPGLDQVENWTKWRLYLGEGESRRVVHAMSQEPLLGQMRFSQPGLEFPLTASLEWRPAYSVVISRSWWTGAVAVEERHPWYSHYGIYSHYHVQVEGGTVRFVPNFMFGLSLDWILRLYPLGAEEMPITGW